jgi:hypothetical protein
MLPPDPEGLVGYPFWGHRLPPGGLKSRKGKSRYPIGECRRLAGHHEFEARSYVDCGPNRSCDRTPLRVQGVNTFDRLGIGIVPLQLVVDVNPFDHEHFAFELNLTGRFTNELAAACINPTRLQRAPEGTG